MKRVLLALLLPMSAAHAGTIYLCKAYSGGMFWSSAHCNQHNALIDRTASVPDGLPWDQQVSIGEQQRQGAAALVAPQSTPTYVQSQPSNSQGECAALDARVAQLAAMARQPQGGASQDWIRTQEKSARDRQFALRCR
jgi:hypothetical protein